MQCKAKKANGQACRMAAIKGKKYCYIHAPETARARAVSRKAGGQNRSVPHAGGVVVPGQLRTVQDVTVLLEYVMHELLIKENGVPRNRALIAVGESSLKSLSLGEIEQRIAALEALAKK